MLPTITVGIVGLSIFTCVDAGVLVDSQMFDKNSELMNVDLPRPL